MRFMIMVKANKDSEAGVLPDEKILSEMSRYNEQLVKAGALLAGEVEIRPLFELTGFPVDPAEKPDGRGQLEQRPRDGGA